MTTNSANSKLQLKEKTGVKTWQVQILERVIIGLSVSMLFCTYETYQQDGGLILSLEQEIEILHEQRSLPVSGEYQEEADNHATLVECRENV